MTFDEKRVGCGMSHPLIKVGAKGFFADNIATLKEYVAEGYGAYDTLKRINPDGEYPYIRDSYENTIESLIPSIGIFKFFYVVEEAEDVCRIDDDGLIVVGSKTLSLQESQNLVREYVDRFGSLKFKTIYNLQEGIPKGKSHD